MSEIAACMRINNEMSYKDLAGINGLFQGVRYMIKQKEAQQS